MDYAEFKSGIRELVQDKLGCDYTLTVQEVIKNNGIILDGLFISKEAERITPTIYLNSYYKQYEMGMSILETADSIISCYMENRGTSIKNIKCLMDYEDAKKFISFKLIQKDTNQRLLQDIPSYDLLDLSIVFYLDLGAGDEGEITAMIHNSHMKSWGVSKEELYDRAKENSSRLHPACISPMEEVMLGILREQGLDDNQVEMTKMLIGSRAMEPPFYILTNKTGVNGASCILYENCLSDFAETLGADIVILPSSLHEVLLLPDRGQLDYQDLQEMVQQINKTEVMEEDILSNKIYHYARLENKLTVIETD